MKKALRARKTRQGRLAQRLRAKPASCHPDKPLYAKGMCRSCYEKHLREVNPTFAERQRKNNRKWRHKHAKRKQQADRDYRAKQDPEWKWAHSLWSSHHITPDQYRAIFRRQKGRCAICGRRPKTSRLAVDHCHQTGYIRGLLCFRCNFGLSWFQDNPSWLRRASKHVTNHVHLEQ
jgi:hypothetical protein